MQSIREERKREMTLSSLEELLREIVEGIELPLVRARIQGLIQDNHLASSLTHSALQKEARELLTALREEGGRSENPKD